MFVAVTLSHESGEAKQYFVEGKCGFKEGAEKTEFGLCEVDVS